MMINPIGYEKEIDFRHINLIICLKHECSDS